MTTVDPVEVAATEPDPEFDRFDVRRARHAPGILGAFNHAGVLNAADVHVATRLAAINGDASEKVLLAAALAVRAPRLGHVCTDLSTVSHTVTVDADLPVDVSSLPWPDPADWVGHLHTSGLVAVGLDGATDRPLRLVDTLLYLDRYWREERQVAAALSSRAGQPAADLDTETLDEGLERIFGPGPGDATDLPRRAAMTALARRLAVVAGGPGTGKTTTVARILALLDVAAAAAGDAPPLVALAAPTGKAAARLEEAVHAEAGRMDIDPAARARLLGTGAATLHRLLGTLPRNRARFRHDRANRLPHDVVVVDETSMVPLSLMARLLEAVRDSARLVLVGDPEQLASVEAGAVLGDIVGGETPPAGTSGTIGDSVVILRHVHRHGGAIADLAAAVRSGDPDAALSVLGRPDDNVTWIPVDVGADGHEELAAVRSAAVAAGRRVVDSARAGDARTALDALGGFRLLCPHRRGPCGVSTWAGRVQSWLAASVDDYVAEGLWYAGRPLLVTENDYALRLYNGDTGVVVSVAGDRLAAVFERRGELLEFSPSRLAAVESLHAMTIHKSQGSQFDVVAVLLPEPDSPILTRELLYTASTRAAEHLILVGTEDSVRAAVTRPIARASGLRRWLWGE